MVKKLSEEEKELINKLYVEGISIAYISDRINQPYGTVYSYVKRELKTDYQDKAILKPVNRGICYYQRERAKEREKKPINKRFSNLILERLVIMDKSQRQLANEIKVSESRISCYIKGSCLPRKDLIPEIFKALDLPYENLYDLIKSPNPSDFV